MHSLSLKGWGMGEQIRPHACLHLFKEKEIPKVKCHCFHLSLSGVLQSPTPSPLWISCDTKALLLLEDNVPSLDTFLTQLKPSVLADVSFHLARWASMYLSLCMSFLSHTSLKTSFWFPSKRKRSLLSVTTYLFPPVSYAPCPMRKIGWWIR